MHATANCDIGIVASDGSSQGGPQIGFGVPGITPAVKSGPTASAGDTRQDRRRPPPATGRVQCGAGSTPADARSAEQVRLRAQEPNAQDRRWQTRPLPRTTTASVGPIGGSCVAREDDQERWVRLSSTSRGTEFCPPWPGILTAWRGHGPANSAISVLRALDYAGAWAYGRTLPRQLRIVSSFRNSPP